MPIIARPVSSLIVLQERAVYAGLPVLSPSEVVEMLEPVDATRA